MAYNKKILVIGNTDNNGKFLCSQEFYQQVIMPIDDLLTFNRVLSLVKKDMVKCKIMKMHTGEVFPVVINGTAPNGTIYTGILHYADTIEDWLQNGIVIGTEGENDIVIHLDDVYGQYDHPEQIPDMDNIFYNFSSLFTI